MLYFLVCILVSLYIYAEYDRNKSEEVSQEILENIEFLEEHEIKIPSLAKMLYEFRKNGIEIKLEEWTKEELTNKIIEVAKK